MNIWVKKLSIFEYLISSYGIEKSNFNKSP